MTNNATASRKGYREKFSKHSIDVEHASASLLSSLEETADVSSQEELFTSGSASAHYIKSILPDLPHDKRGIFVIGQEGFEEELREVGLEFKGGAVRCSRLLSGVATNGARRTRARTNIWSATASASRALASN